MSDNTACGEAHRCHVASVADDCRPATPKAQKRWAPHSRFTYACHPHAALSSTLDREISDGLPFARAAGGRAPEAIFLSSVPTTECPGIVSGPGG